MTPSDIALHYRLNTVVGKWLEDKMAEWEARTFLIKEPWHGHGVLEP
jgi:hypothetical protein